MTLCLYLFVHRNSLYMCGTLVCKQREQKPGSCHHTNTDTHTETHTHTHTLTILCYKIGTSGCDAPQSYMLYAMHTICHSHHPGKQTVPELIPSFSSHTQHKHAYTRRHTHTNTPTHTHTEIQASPVSHCIFITCSRASEM